MDNEVPWAKFCEVCGGFSGLHEHDNAPLLGEELAIPTGDGKFQVWDVSPVPMLDYQVALLDTALLSSEKASWALTGWENDVRKLLLLGKLSDVVPGGIDRVQALRQEFKIVYNAIYSFRVLGHAGAFQNKTRPESAQNEIERLRARLKELGG